MSVAPTIVCLLALLSNRLALDVGENTELVLAFMTHRHGDRTPVEQTIHFVTNTHALRTLIEPYGFGQLTNLGAERSYMLGKFLRKRYDRLLGNKYNHTQVYLRATDSSRAKMTALAVMAAVYPPNDRAWHPDLNWAPTPYTTVPVKYDTNLAMLNCPTFVNPYYAKFASKPSSMDKHSELLQKLATMGYDVTSQPVMAYALYDTFIAASHLGLKLEPEVELLMPELLKAAETAIDIVFGDEEYLALQAGVMLKTFFDTAEAVISGKETRRIWIYSAHDFNVYSLFAAAQARPKPGVPKYSSLFALELRRMAETGQYIVLPVYLNSPDEEEMYPEIEGCGTPCEYEQYKKLMKPYLLSAKEYRKKCNFDEDADIDSSAIE